MKKTLILLALLTFCFTSYGEIYIIVDKNTKEIFSVSEKNDTLIPEGKELIVKQGSFETYPFPEHPANLKFISGKFIVNTEKINKEYQEKVKKEKKDKEEKLITERMRKIARDQLVQEGLIE